MFWFRNITKFSETTYTCVCFKETLFFYFWEISVRFCNETNRHPVIEEEAERWRKERRSASDLSKKNLLQFSRDGSQQHSGLIAKQRTADDFVISCLPHTHTVFHGLLSPAMDSDTEEMMEEFMGSALAQWVCHFLFVTLRLEESICYGRKQSWTEKKIINCTYNIGLCLCHQLFTFHFRNSSNEQKKKSCFLPN